MVVPVIKKNSPLTIADNPSYKECLWLDESLVPAQLKSWNEDLNDWETISDAGNKNLNTSDPYEKYQTWIGNKEEFELLDVLDDDTIYIVRGLGEFIGNLPICELTPKTKYVDNKYTGKRTLGISWEYPFTNLQDALDASNAGDTILVASGEVYINEANSTDSYQITKPVTILGGFLGNERSIEERSLRDKTIISGENKRRIFNNAAEGTIIDGFIIENGHSVSKGGAIFSTKFITVRFCEFKNNSAQYGGALSNVNYTLNCLFEGNSASINGSCVYSSKLPVVNGCTFVNNLGNNVIYCESGVSMQMYNSVIWNAEPGGDGVVCETASSISNCATTADLLYPDLNIKVSRSNDGEDEGINYVRFSDPASHDYDLKKNSDLRDKGIILVPFNQIVDFDGNERISGGSIDIGAYEYQNYDIVRTINGKTGDVNLEIDDVNELEDSLKNLDKSIKDHTNNQDNPHKVTKDQVGLGNVENTSDLDKPISTKTQEALNKISEDLKELNDHKDDNLNKHLDDKENPHEVTKEQIGLDQVDNTSDLDKPISTKTQEALDKVTKDLNDFKETKGQNDGLAELDLNGYLKKSQINPASLNIVEGYKVSDTEFKDKDQELVKLETEKFYVDIAEGQNIIYRWDNSKLVSLGEHIIVGESEGSVYPGEKGKELEDYLKNHINDKDNPHNVTKEQIGLDKVDNTSDLKKPVSEATRLKLNKLRDLLSTKADLFEGKVPISQLPDAILGNVSYQGLWDVESNEPHLILGDEAFNGHYYIAVNSGVRFGFEFEPGDWVINNKGDWQKVDNNDSVKIVNGQKGIVNIGIKDIPNLEGELSEKASNLSLNEHVKSENNPHNVTKEQLGLGNVENTSDLDKPISTKTQEALNKLTESVKSISDKIGIPGGLATLDQKGKLVITQLPDEAIEICLGKYISDTIFNNIDGEAYKPNSNKIYIDITEETNVIYRWDNSIYIPVGGDVKLKDLVKSIVDSKGKANGIATLDENGKLTKSQLPELNIAQNKYVISGRYVDELTFNDQDGNKCNPDQNTIYIDLSVGNGVLYHWNGAKYVTLTNEVENVICEGKYIDATTFNDKSGNPYSPSDNKIYIDITEGQNSIYRWDNSEYVLLSGNSGVTKDQLDNSIKSKADLVEGKVPVSQLPDLPEIITKAVYFKGLWDADSNSPELVNEKLEDNGKYYVVREEGTWHGIEFFRDDLIINANGIWYKVCGQNSYNKLKSELDSLKELVDTLLTSIDFEILKFESNIGTEFNSGEVVSPLLTWEFNVEKVRNIKINGVEVDRDSRAYQMDDISEDTTVVLEVSNGIYRHKAILNFEFGDPSYYGVSTNDVLSENDVSGFETVRVKPGTSTDLEYNEDGYCYIVYPESLGNNAKLVNNANNFEEGWVSNKIEINGVNYIVLRTNHSLYKPNSYKFTI